MRRGTRSGEEDGVSKQTRVGGWTLHPNTCRRYGGMYDEREGRRDQLGWRKEQGHDGGWV